MFSMQEETTASPSPHRCKEARLYQSIWGFRLLAGALLCLTQASAVRPSISGRDD